MEVSDVNDLHSRIDYCPPIRKFPGSLRRLNARASSASLAVPPREPIFVNHAVVLMLIDRFECHLGQTMSPVSENPAHDESIGYLSLAWIRELSREVGESERLAALATDHQIGVTQIVTDGPEGEVTYHLQIGDGTAAFGAGAAEPEDVRMQQSWETAVAVATGNLNAQEAFITGKILLFGDREKLMAAQPVFAALDAVFTAVRPRTRYG